MPDTLEQDMFNELTIEIVVAVTSISGNGNVV